MNLSRAVSTIVVCSALLFVAMTAMLSTNFDFRAFYCAGSALNAHANPYRTEPLHTCERTQTDSTFRVFSSRVALPAPLPGYDVAAFSLLARLPYKTAAAVWTALLVLCSLGAIAVVRQFTKAAWATMAAAFLLSLCVTSIYLGELIPLAVAAIAAAALSAKQRRWALAGIAAAATLVEPHIGVPICFAVFLWAPRARLALGICVAALGALSLSTLGIAQNLEYVLTVLPAHALSEIGSDAQLSASVLAHALGASDATAVRAGEISYAASTLAGVCAAGLVARRYRDSSFLVLVPAAAAVIGGVFMHVTEIAVALPLAIALLQYERGNKALQVCLIVLAVPWWSLATPMVLGTQTGCLLAAIIVTFLFWQFSNQPVLALCAGAAVFSGSMMLTHWYAVANDAFVPASPLVAAIDGRYPEAGWAWENARYASTGSAPAWLLRAPTWAALLMLSAATVVRGYWPHRTLETVAA